jgi:hypothetical protein
MAAAITDRTVLVAVSAPSYAHGVVDPVRDVAGAALARGVRCHVDACIGGWVLPYAARLGRAIPPWTFAVEGVTSISVDLHKYGYAPKGTSVLLHRTAELRRPQLFASADWPGYTMLNSTMQSTKSGGPLAGAWAVTQALGDEGYLRLTAEAFGAVAALSDRWIVGRSPRNESCGWTYQPARVIASVIVKTSHVSSVLNATSVESGGTTTDSGPIVSTPATSRSTPSRTARVSSR